MSEPISDYAAAREAMRCRLSVLRNLERHDRGMPMMFGLMQVDLDYAEAGNYRFADHIRNQLIMTLAEGETYVATDEICQLLDNSHASYPTSQMFMSDILTPAGLVYFTQPIADPDRMDNLPIRAVSWQVFPVADEVPDEDDPGNVQLVPTGTHAVTLIGYTDTRLLPDAVEHGLENYPRIYPVVSVIWEVDAPDGGSFVGADPELLAASKTRRAPYIKALMAYWAIVRQRLTAEQEVVIREHAKELKAAQRKRTVNATTKIIRLKGRSKKYVYTGDHGFNRPDWQHSWMVRPHWRMQWYPKTQEHKPKLILSYPKGPDDKPMLGADRVFLPPKPLDE